MKDEKSVEFNSYLTFRLGNELFALHVSKVLNILEMAVITEVPKAPVFMKGVMSLRGIVLPVIDTRLKFGMTETQYTDKTCIIVLELDLDNQKVYIGSLVDEVSAVIELEEKQIDPPPSIGSKFKSEFIYGMTKQDEKFIMLLDMEKVMSNLDINELKELTGEKKEETIKTTPKKDSKKKTK